MIPPILMYHRIGHRPGDGITVSPELFELQLKKLKQQNYQTMSLFEWHQMVTTDTPIPKKTIIITFDDGYRDNLQIAAPLLKKYGFTATVFPVAEQIGKVNNWDNVAHRLGAELMSVEELKEWHRLGFEIGSHGMTHAAMNQIDSTSIRYESYDSKALLEKLLGIPIHFFCYPYGFLSEESKVSLKSAGYLGALAILYGAQWDPIDWFAIPRVKISERDQPFTFSWKVSSLHKFFAQSKYRTKRIKEFFKGAK